jgi:Ca2+-binding RTX toxin-like protein
MAAGDSYAHVERVTGSSHGDLFYGDAGPNDFRGLGGYDTFVGSAGGRERYDGGSGLDTVTYYQSAAGVTASLLLGYGSGGDASRDLYTSIENLTGSGHGDVLTGDHGRNSLRGLSGDDFLFGNGGVDRLQGGGGNDSIDGGAGSDYALFSGARAAYAVTRLDTDSVLVIGPEGRDQLENVEYFQFDDMVLRIWDL